MKLLTFALLLFYCLRVNAQQGLNKFSAIDIEVSGDPAIRITSITQDSLGYIWMASEMGLLKYNGYETVQFTGPEGDTARFDGRFIEVLFCDSFGHIWIGSKSGLTQYNPYADTLRFHQAVSDTTKPTNFVLDIAEDPQKNIWAISAHGRLFQYKRAENRFYSYLDNRADSAHLLDDVARHLLCDNENNIWIGTGFGRPENGNGLVKFNPTTREVKRYLHDPKDESSLLDNRVSALYQDQNGQILIGTYQCGLHVYQANTDSFKRLHYDPANPHDLHAPCDDILYWNEDPFIQIIHQDRQGGYWIGTAGVGINHFQQKNRKVRFYGSSSDYDGLQTLEIWSFFEDQQSNLWVSSIGGGAYTMDLYSPQYSTITESFNPLDYYESPFLPGTVWICTNGRGLLAWNLKTDEIQTVFQIESEKVNYNWTRDIFQENERTLWLGLGTGGASAGSDGKGGLVKLDIPTGSYQYFSFSNPEEPDHRYTVFTIDEDHKGRLWLGTREGGFFRSNKEKTKFERFVPEVEDVNESEIYYYIIQNGPQDKFWLASQNLNGGGTLYYYDYSNETAVPFLRGFHITNIVEDRKGELWIGTWDNGILHIHPEDNSYDQYSVDDGLPSNDHIYIIGNRTDTFWIHTTRGPARLDVNNKRITPVKSLKGINSQWGGILTSDGRVVIENPTKVTAFYPDQVMGNPFPPKATISKFISSGTDFKINFEQASPLQLKHNQNDIHIEYTAMHYSNPEDNTYKYRLLPVDEGWIDAGKERIARYADLDPGKYTFRILTASSTGIWNEEAYELGFEIAPPWWQTWWAYLSYSCAFAGGMLGFIQYRSRAIIQKNRLLEKKVAERTHTLEQRSNELKESLENLKIAQQQLIQSEKLASLGELTAGIAHEIQNPLNFVNNFSELSQELVEEMIIEVQNDSKTEAIEIANDLSSNLSKILHHGKRADSIVKGMLLHSRDTSSQKESTDIKKLIDEYLRLAYHGLRAKDKSFNAHIQTFHDENIDRVYISPSEFGRVLLNLITNAFYAVHEKSKHQKEDFTPVIQIKTKDEGETISISVGDNGTGIPEEIKKKIFQPFFSTKPTGEGTGLGLSLAFDIITKGHQGELAVESKVGEGTEFIITIPKKNTHQ